MNVWHGHEGKRMDLGGDRLPVGWAYMDSTQIFDPVLTAPMVEIKVNVSPE